MGGAIGRDLPPLLFLSTTPKRPSRADVGDGAEGETGADSTTSEILLNVVSFLRIRLGEFHVWSHKERLSLG